tara:strand:+ start:370 stop:1029 length:660 start_codon:yes stop_codon:yes gene_type:complete
MKKIRVLAATLILAFSVSLAYSQATVQGSLSYASFNYDISGTKYTGDGGALSLQGQLSPNILYDLNVNDGKFDDVVFQNSEGSLTYLVFPNIGVDMLGSQIKLATVKETDTSVGLSYHLYGSSMGIRVFAASDINNYGKNFTYGTKINLGLSSNANILWDYKTEDRKQKVTTMGVRVTYGLSSSVGLNLGYKTTETKNAAGTAVVLKGNTTYAGLSYKF